MFLVTTDVEFETLNKNVIYVKFMYDICCIGHITHDRVITPVSDRHMAGGTAFYFSNALARLNVSYCLLTAVADGEVDAIEELRALDVEVKTQETLNTLYFENIYPENQDHRTQRVLQQAEPFVVEGLNEIEAEYFHLGPLLANDIPLELIVQLSERSTVSLDVQGYLRKVENYQVYPVEWMQKQDALPFVDILKANDTEVEVLTGLADMYEGARLLAGWGVKEVVVTLGSRGSIIYTDGVFYEIPVFKPETIKDATGCGDTYMAGYLYKRSLGASVKEAGYFASAMAGLKIASAGPFSGTEDDVINFMKQMLARR